jgi:hypothetical protein
MNYYDQKINRRALVGRLHDAHFPHRKRLEVGPTAVILKSMAQLGGAFCNALQGDMVSRIRAGTIAQLKG